MGLTIQEVIDSITEKILKIIAQLNRNTKAVDRNTDEIAELKKQLSDERGNK